MYAICIRTVGPNGKPPASAYLKTGGGVACRVEDIRSFPTVAEAVAHLREPERAATLRDLGVGVPNDSGITPAACVVLFEEAARDVQTFAERKPEGGYRFVALDSELSDQTMAAMGAHLAEARWEGQGPWTKGEAEITIDPDLLTFKWRVTECEDAVRTFNEIVAMAG